MLRRAALAAVIGLALSLIGRETSFEVEGRNIYLAYRDDTEIGRECDIAPSLFCVPRHGVGEVAIMSVAAARKLIGDATDNPGFEISFRHNRSQIGLPNTNAPLLSHRLSGEYGISGNAWRFGVFGRRTMGYLISLDRISGVSDRHGGIDADHRIQGGQMTSIMKSVFKFYLPNAIRIQRDGLYQDRHIHIYPGTLFIPHFIQLSPHGAKGIKRNYIASNSCDCQYYGKYSNVARPSRHNTLVYSALGLSFLCLSIIPLYLGFKGFEYADDQWGGFWFFAPLISGIAVATFLIYQGIGILLAVAECGYSAPSRVQTGLFLQVLYRDFGHPNRR